MSQTNNIAVTQLAQLGLAERIAQETQGHPESTRHAGEQAALLALKQQKDSVGATQDSESSRGVKTKKEGGEPRGGTRDRKRRHKDDSSPEEDEDNASSPWAGNIVNFKV